MTNDLSITPMLQSRIARARDHAVEYEGVRRIAEAIAKAPADMPRASAAAALAATGATSCGIYLLESNDGEEKVVRLAVAGAATHRFPDAVARYLSPVAVCVEAGQPVLLRRPDRVYPYLSAGPPIDEMLLVPLRGQGGLVRGAIWVTSQGPAPAFDGGDTRFLELVATFLQIALDAHSATEASQATSRRIESLTRATVDLGRSADLDRATAAAHALAFTELEHRVKNTLMMAATVLRWEAERTDSPHAIRALEGARRRVVAVGEMDRLATVPGEVDVGAAVRDLCAAVAGSDPRFKVQIAAAELRAPGPAAAIVGLIVNELLTNAIKHAAAGPESVVAINVSLSRDGPDQAVLAVTDDGAPFAPVPGRTKGLGLSLVNGLARQLGGSLDINAAKKLFLVTFPTGRQAYAGVARSPSSMALAD